MEHRNEFRFILTKHIILSNNFLFVFQYVTTRKKLTLCVIHLCNDCRKILFLPNVTLMYEKFTQQSINYGSTYIAKRGFNTFYNDYNMRAWQLSKVIPERNLIKPFPICFIDAPAKDPCASHTIHHHAAWKVSTHSCAYTHKGNKDACARTGWSQLVDAYSQPFMHTPIHTSLWLTLNTFCRRSMWTWLRALPLKPCTLLCILLFQRGCWFEVEKLWMKDSREIWLKEKQRRWGKSTKNGNFEVFFKLF